MKSTSLTLLLVSLSSPAVGQTAPAVPRTAVLSVEEDKPAPASAPAEGKPARPRATSPDMAAKISAAIPKFSPPKAADAPKSTEQPDLRETDKPRNGIIRLPEYLVQERKAPAFKERELLSPAAKLTLAYKRYPGLHFGSLPFLSNNGIARLMLEEDFRLERKAEMEELAGLYQYSDPKTAAMVKSETDQVFMRHEGP
jgi:hypothetical protein